MTPPNEQTRADDLELLDCYWRAANYLSVGQIYLFANPLLREPLKIEHVKPRLLGHWGTTPGLNFIYAHFNRAHQEIRSQRDLLCRARPRRPRHGREHLSRRHLQRVLSQHYAETKTACKSCSNNFPFPAEFRAMPRPKPRARSMKAASWAIRSCTRMARYSIIPDLLACCVVGDGEAETGPLATSWHSAISF